MSNKNQEYSIQGLTRAYLNERDVYTAEKLLDKLVADTNTDNLTAILETMKMDPNLHELDLSLFINGVASPDLPQLTEVINELRKTFKDHDALEDLDEAEKKISNS